MPGREARSWRRQQSTASFCSHRGPPGTDFRQGPHGKHFYSIMRHKSRQMGSEVGPPQVGFAHDQVLSSRGAVGPPVPRLRLPPSLIVRPLSFDTHYLMLSSSLRAGAALESRTRRPPLSARSGVNIGSSHYHISSVIGTKRIFSSKALQKSTLQSIKSIFSCPPATASSFLSSIQQVRGGYEFQISSIVISYDFPSLLMVCFVSRPLLRIFAGAELPTAGSAFAATAPFRFPIAWFLLFASLFGCSPAFSVHFAARTFASSKHVRRFQSLSFLFSRG